MNFPCNRVLPLLLALSFPALAQTTDSITSTTRTQQANWYLVQTARDSPAVSVRLNGVAKHGDRTSPAMMQVTCNAAMPRAVVALFVSTDQLGFKPDAYEGPSAITRGPLSLTTGHRAPHHYAVNGIYTTEVARHGDFVFSLYEASNHKELIDWTTDRNRGQPVSMSLPSAVTDDPPLVARFVLPQDNSVFRKLTEPCTTPSGSNHPQQPPTGGHG